MKKKSTNAAPKATRAKQGAHVAPAKGKAGKKAASAKKAPTARQNATGARAGSKTAQVLELLKRPQGATAAELMAATGWQAHSVRGFIATVMFSGRIGFDRGMR